MRTLKTELIEKGLSDARASEVEPKCINTNSKSKEKLSDKDLRELMGVNRDTFGRGKGGAIRRR